MTDPIADTATPVATGYETTLAVMEVDRARALALAADPKATPAELRTALKYMAADVVAMVDIVRQGRTP
jgi:hypothetical protein